MNLPCIYCNNLCLQNNSLGDLGFLCTSCPGQPHYILLHPDLNMGDYSISFGSKLNPNYWLVYFPQFNDIEIIHYAHLLYRTKDVLDSAESAVNYLERFLELKAFL